MPHLETIIAVVIAGFALSATPGPSMLYVLSRSVGQSRAAGMASAFGLALGGVILAVATAFGLAAIFSKYAWLVVVMSYVGSGYLFWLGANLIFSAKKLTSTTNNAPNVSPNSFQKIIWQGVLVEVLNPKTVLFFALFLPPFVNTEIAQTTANGVQFQLVILGALVPLTAIPSDVFVAFWGGTMSQIMGRKQKFQVLFSWAGGVVLIGIAANLLFEHIVL